MTSMTPELSQAIHDAAGKPVRIVDPTTHETYVVVREEIFQRVQTLLDDDVDPKSLYLLLADLSPEDWEDGAAYGLPQSP